MVKDKKVVVKTLAEDLQAIFKNDFPVDECIKTTNQTILKSKEVSLIFAKKESNYFNVARWSYSQMIKEAQKYLGANLTIKKQIISKYCSYGISPNTYIITTIFII